MLKNRKTTELAERQKERDGGTKKITKTKDKKAANPNPGLKGFGGNEYDVLKRIKEI
jgi:hypothetical protein